MAVNTRTLQYHLNRLAGTLVNGVPTHDAQGAASIWAGTTNTDLVGALNVKAGNTKPNWRELAGVLNQLAGTTGLEVDGAAAAINRTILTLTDPTTADTLYSPAPTGTTLQQLTTSIPSGVSIPWDDARLRKRGAGGFILGTVSPDTVLTQPSSVYPHTYGSPPYWSFEFVLTGQVFEVLFKYATASRMRLRVNGKPVTILPEATGGTTAGSRHVRKFDFGTVATRRITVEVYAMPFGGIFVEPTATVTAPPAFAMRGVFQGDSITAGSAENTGSGLGTWMQRIAPWVGIDDPWNQAIGGTGYTNAASAVVVPTRTAADVVAYSPRVVFLWAGYNDGGQTYAAVRPPVDQTIGDILTGLPGVEMYVLGCWSPQATPAPSHTPIDDAIRDAAAAARVPFISPLTGRVINRAGVEVANAGKWITSANVATMIGTDAVHPNDAGHELIAHRVFDAVTALTAVSVP